MIDPLSLAVGGALLAAGWLAGRVTRRRPASHDGKPICGCDHHRSMHDPQTYQCHGMVYEGMGIYNRCTCRQYIGPEPISSEIWAPPIERGAP